MLALRNWRRIILCLLFAELSAWAGKTCRLVISQQSCFDGTSVWNCKELCETGNAGLYRRAGPIHCRTGRQQNMLLELRHNEYWFIKHNKYWFIKQYIFIAQGCCFSFSSVWVIGNCNILRRVIIKFRLKEVHILVCLYSFFRVMIIETWFNFKYLFVTEHPVLGSGHQ